MHVGYSELLVIFILNLNTFLETHMIKDNLSLFVISVNKSDGVKIRSMMSLIFHFQLLISHSNSLFRHFFFLDSYDEYNLLLYYLSE